MDVAAELLEDIWIHVLMDTCMHVYAYVHVHVYVYGYV